MCCLIFQIICYKRLSCKLLVINNPLGGGTKLILLGCLEFIVEQMIYDS